MRGLGGSRPINACRPWSKRVGMRDAYGIHAIDTEVPAGDSVLVHEPSGAACYWDADERFVAVVGDQAFLRLVRQYPGEIERVYYMQMMSTVGVNEVNELGMLQQWYALRDPGMEEALYDTPVMRHFAGPTRQTSCRPDRITPGASMGLRLREGWHSHRSFKATSMNSSLRSDIVLSVSKALPGEVFPEIVAVSCEVGGESKLQLTFFVDSALPAFKAEDISCIEAEVLTDFPSNFDISHKVVVSRQASLPARDAFWIF